MLNIRKLLNIIPRMRDIFRRIISYLLSFIENILIKIQKKLSGELKVRFSQELFFWTDSRGLRSHRHIWNDRTTVIVLSTYVGVWSSYENIPWALHFFTRACACYVTHGQIYTDRQKMALLLCLMTQLTVMLTTEIARGLRVLNRPSKQNVMYETWAQP